jgi:type I restriction enzyme M protein
VLDEKLLFETAEKINVILHNGATSATDRGKVISALILGLAGDTGPNPDTPQPNVVHSQPDLSASPSVLIAGINARVKEVLQREGKPEFYDYIRVALPATTENHLKFKTALVRTIRELNHLNIRSAMNSGTNKTPRKQKSKTLNTTTSLG